MATAAGGLLLFATVGPDTAYFPTVFVACFAIGFGIGNAFMPLLTLAMADVPAADAGLGSGITNVSQQISGALGLAVLSTVAANHTKGLVADDNGLTGVADRRLPGRVPGRRGRHRRGIVLAFALLRPRAPRRCSSPRPGRRSTPARPHPSPWRRPHEAQHSTRGQDPSDLRGDPRLLHP